MRIWTLLLTTSISLGLSCCTPLSKAPVADSIPTLDSIFAEPVIAPAHPMQCDVQTVQGQQQVPSPEQLTIASTFANEQDAQRFFTGIQPQTDPLTTANLLGQTVFLSTARPTLPEWKSQLLNDFVDVEIITRDPNYEEDFVITLSALAPSDQAAKNVEESLRLYSIAPYYFYLRPPWMPTTVRQETKQSEDKARYTYAKLTRLSIERAPNIRPISLFEAIIESLLNIRNIQKRIQKSGEEGERLALQELSSHDNPNIDQDIVEMYRNRPKMTLDYSSVAQTRADVSIDQLYEWGLKIGKKMGQLPIEGGQVIEQAHAYSGGTSPVRSDLWLHFEPMGFTDPHVGLPAFMNYLCAKGFSSMKYSVMDWNTIRAD